jgi:hypothetical protein
MKAFLIIMLLWINTLDLYAQHHAHGYLRVKRKSSNTEFTVKTHKPITIRLHNGELYRGKNYHITDNMIVFNQTDSIAPIDIDYISARVYGNTGRKVLGWLITTAGIGAIVLGFNVHSLEVWASSGNESTPSLIMYLLPGLVITTTGSLILGPTKFNSSKWEFLLL